MSTLPKPFVFVLMPFEQKFNAERVDEQIYGGEILDRIFNQISKADVIVADMTSVFTEASHDCRSVESYETCLHACKMRDSRRLFCSQLVRDLVG